MSQMFPDRSSVVLDPEKFTNLFDQERVIISSLYKVAPDHGWDLHTLSPIQTRSSVLPARKPDIPEGGLFATGGESAGKSTGVPHAQSPQYSSTNQPIISQDRLVVDQRGSWSSLSAEQEARDHAVTLWSAILTKCQISPESSSSTEPEYAYFYMGSALDNVDSFGSPLPFNVNGGDDIVEFRRVGFRLIPPAPQSRSFARSLNPQPETEDEGTTILESQAFRAGSTVRGGWDKFADSSVFQLDTRNSA